MRPFISALALVLWLASSAWAVPLTMTLYTDRAAFDAAAGPYILLNEDAPHDVFFPSGNPQEGSVVVTYPALFRVIGDAVSATPYFPFIIGPAGGLPTDWFTLVPVTAFGFDVVNASDNEIVNPTLSFGGGTFPLVGLSFVGLISTSPIGVGGDNFPHTSYVMSNLAIQPFVASAVPEPSSGILLSGAIVALISGLAWRQRTP
jgi:hypothetical protein